MTLQYPGGWPSFKCRQRPSFRCRLTDGPRRTCTTEGQLRSVFCGYAGRVRVWRPAVSAISAVR